MDRKGGDELATDPSRRDNEHVNTIQVQRAMPTARSKFWFARADAGLAGNAVDGVWVYDSDTTRFIDHGCEQLVGWLRVSFRAAEADIHGAIVGLRAIGALRQHSHLVICDSPASRASAAIAQVDEHSFTTHADR